MAGEFSSFATVPNEITPPAPEYEYTIPSNTVPPPEEEEVVEVITPGFAVLIDEVSDTVTYIGKADPGSDTSHPVWAIQRLTETGPDLVVEWAGGTADFDKIWDDRLSLSYS